MIYLNTYFINQILLANQQIQILKKKTLQIHSCIVYSITVVMRLTFLTNIIKSI